MEFVPAKSQSIEIKLWWIQESNLSKWEQNRGKGEMPTALKIGLSSVGSLFCEKRQLSV